MPRPINLAVMTIEADATPTQSFAQLISKVWLNVKNCNAERLKKKDQKKKEEGDHMKNVELN